MYQRTAYRAALIFSALSPLTSYAQSCEEANIEAIRIYENIRKSDTQGESLILSSSLSDLAKNNPDCIVPSKLSKAAIDTLGRSRGTALPSSVCPDDRACIVEKKQITNNTAEGKANPLD